MKQAANTHVMKRKKNLTIVHRHMITETLIKYFMICLKLESRAQIVSFSLQQLFASIQAEKSDLKFDKQAVQTEYAPIPWKQWVTRTAA